MKKIETVKFLGQDYFICHDKTYNQILPLHFHDEYEILFFLTDNVICTVGTKSYTLKSGSAAVFNGDDIHSVIAPKNILYDRFSLHFSSKFIQDICLSYPEITEQFVNRSEDFRHCISFDESQKEKMLTLLNKMLECYETKGNDSYELKIKLALCEILLYLNEIYKANQINPPLKRYEYRERLHIVMEYIKDNLADKLDLDILSKKIFTNEQTLIKIFKTATGLTPHQYIMYCRIMKARGLLREETPVHKVCELVGYSNISSFIRAFKKITGYTPTDYKKN